jgi:hypothetical protein
MKAKLISRFSRLLPTAETKSFHLKRNAEYTPDKFLSYNDWFYFIHVDPYLRWVHASGMMIGILFYIVAAYNVWIFGLRLSAGFQVMTGVFFFYFLPLISHYFYDGGSAKSTPDKFHSTLIPVIHINLLTLTGTYDQWLRKFIQKYPFTVEAWQLEEKNVRE